jgi:hypothetical protein
MKAMMEDRSGTRTDNAEHRHKSCKTKPLIDADNADSVTQGTLSRRWADRNHANHAKVSPLRLERGEGNLAGADGRGWGEGKSGRCRNLI